MSLLLTPDPWSLPCCAAAKAVVVVCEVLAVLYAAAGLLVQLQALLRANDFLHRYRWVWGGAVALFMQQWPTAAGLKWGLGFSKEVDCMPHGIKYGAAQRHFWHLRHSAQGADPVPQASAAAQQPPGGPAQPRHAAGALAAGGVRLWRYSTSTTGLV